MTTKEIKEFDQLVIQEKIKEVTNKPTLLERIQKLEETVNASHPR